MRNRFSVLLTLLTVGVLIAVVHGCNAEPKVVASFKHLNKVSCLAFSPDGRYLVAGSEGISNEPVECWLGKVIVYEIATRKKIATLLMPQWIQSIAFAPDGKTIAVSCGSGNWHPNPNYLGYIRKAGEVRILSFPKLKEKRRLFAGNEIHFVRFSPDGNTLATSSFTYAGDGDKGATNEVALWDLTKFTKRLTLAGIKMEGPPAIDFAPNGKEIAVGEYNFKIALDGEIKFFDPTNGQLVRRLRLNENAEPGQIQYSPTGKTIAVTYGGGVVRLWKVPGGEDCTPERLIKAYSKALWSDCRFHISPNGKVLAAAGTRGGGSPMGQAGVLVWDLSAQKLLHQWKWPQRRVILSSIAVSPNGSLLAIGTNSAQVKVFRLENE